MNRFIIFTIIVFSLVACEKGHSTDVYQLTASSDGRVYRLNKITGEIWLVEKDGLKVIGSSDIVIDRKALDEEMRRRGLK